MRKAKRWYRNPKSYDRESPPIESPDVMLFGPYFKANDTWLGVYWVHNVQGWDGGWFEGWRFYVVLFPTIVLELKVDRSFKQTRAYKKWRRETLRNLP